MLGRSIATSKKIRLFKEQKHSLLCLSNNCSIKNIFENICGRFSKLYRTKAYAHHYNDFGVDDSYFKGSLETVKQLINDYNTIDGEENDTKRLTPVQLS